MEQAFSECVRTMFRLPPWIECLKISPAGAELLLAQGVTGVPDARRFCAGWGG